jgi:phosphate transport system substrate-binding protein
MMLDSFNKAMENSMTKCLVQIFVVTMMILHAGCMTERKETTTKGHAIVAVAESVSPVITQEKIQFEDLYPEAKVDLLTMTDREAVTRMFNDTMKVIVLSRPLNPEEQQVAKKYKIEFQELKIAIDGIAILVNDKNPLTQLRTTQLDSIFSGMVTNWKALGGKSGSIELCLPDPNSGIFEVAGMKILNGKKFTTPTSAVTTSKAMMEFVSGHPAAIGMIGLNWVSEKKENVRVLELSDPNAPDSLNIKGQYFGPHQAYVYKGFYPLTTNVYIYSRSDMYSVGAGFSSFIASGSGQKIILNNGLVPATMPVRLVQLTNKGI